MDPKDFKFNDDAFDDVFTSNEDDGFEDIYSEADKNEEKSFENEFDDIFSGRNDMSSNKDRAYTEEYFSDSDTGEFRSVKRVDVNQDVESKPYSYNYSKASQNKARRVSEDRNYDTVDGDISSGKQPREKRKRKKFSFGKFLLIFVALILVAAIGLGSYGYMFAKGLTKKVDYKPLKANEHISSSELMRKDGVKNILLIGVDARPGESNDETRSDTMMLLTIDENNSQLKLTSFLRDTYIEIPGYKKAKLNAAQSHGGTQLLVDTIEYNFKIDIDNYMLVNFDMFITIIDSLGGIDIEVTEKEAKYINSKDHMTSVEESYFPEKIESGSSVHLTGGQALWYARIRYLDSDFMRTQRQRKVMSAILAKAKSTDFKTLVDMVEKIVPMVSTDISSDELMKLGMNALKYMKFDLCQQQIPAEGTWESKSIKKQSVLVPDLDKNKTIVQNFVFEKADKNDNSKNETATNKK